MISVCVPVVVVVVVVVVVIVVVVAVVVVVVVVTARCVRPRGRPADTKACGRRSCHPIPEASLLCEPAKTWSCESRLV